MYTQMWRGKDQMEEGGRGDRPNNHNLCDWLENTVQITHK